MHRNPFAVRYGFGVIMPGEDNALFTTAQSAIARVEALPNFDSLLNEIPALSGVYNNLRNTLQRIADPNDALTIASQVGGLRDWTAFLNNVGQTPVDTGSGNTSQVSQSIVDAAWAAINRIDNNRAALVNVPADFNNVYDNLLNTLNAISAGTLTAESQADGLAGWANYLNSIQIAASGPIDDGGTDDTTDTTSGGVVTTSPTGGTGFFDGIQDRIAEMFSGLAAKTGLSPRTLEIGAVVLGVGALVVFNSDGGSKRKR